jgi:hypothetical protein
MRFCVLWYKLSDVSDECTACILKGFNSEARNQPEASIALQRDILSQNLRAQTEENHESPQSGYSNSVIQRCNRVLTFLPQKLMGGCPCWLPHSGFLLGVLLDLEDGGDISSEMPFFFTEYEDVISLVRSIDGKFERQQSLRGYTSSIHSSSAADVTSSHV